MERDPFSQIRITVGDIASSPVFQLNKDSTVEEAARQMELHDVGAIVVVNSSAKTVGIVTERDIVTRAIAKGKDPRLTKVAEVMSSPLVKIEHDKSLIRALDAMRLHKFRRLGVVKNDKLVGIVTERDIMRAVPAILEKYYGLVASRGAVVNRVDHYEGYCEECGQWSEGLTYSEGRFLCETCGPRLGVSAEGL
jgi:CBS domain-containing protein